MGREIPFEPDAVCDSCGAKGAYDLMGDYYCGECLEQATDDDGDEEQDDEDD